MPNDATASTNVSIDSVTRPENLSTRRLEFPPSFVWGSATSSYQIEGAVDSDGRVPSIWDTFSHTPGKTKDGRTGDVACDHYNRSAADVDLMASLNLDAYRFSIAWPRIVSDATGTVNSAGLDFYDRLVDDLLAQGIRPFPTLYHWDLPQYLDDLGGWLDRDTAYRFADYANAVVGRLGDRIDTWTTLNEPFVSANHGYVTGEHAPGHTSMAEGMTASHHLLLAHGLAAERIRSSAPDARVAIVVNITATEAGSDSEADRLAAHHIDQLHNFWYTDPIGGFGYPADTAEYYDWDQSEVLDGDLDIISAPIDLLGVNYYSRQVVYDDREDTRDVPRNVMGWEIHPPSLGRVLRWLNDRYGFPGLMITENGAPMPDTIRADGRIIDNDRIDYVSRHLAQVHEAIGDGVPMEGYLVWSFMDNFEWGWGYGPTFGIVEVEDETLRRIPKSSALWFANAAAAGGFDFPVVPEAAGSSDG